MIIKNLLTAQIFLPGIIQESLHEHSACYFHNMDSNFLNFSIGIGKDIVFDLANGDPIFLGFTFFQVDVPARVQILDGIELLFFVVVLYQY